MKILIDLKPVLKNSLLLILIVLFSSCEDDFTTLGSDFVNSLNVPEPYVVENLASYSDKITSVQSNSLNNYLLGNFEDPVFGSSEISILTQLQLQRTNPDFGENPILDSVVLTLPLFSTLTETDTYRIDSVFGEGSFKISVFKSNQFLRDLDPGENGNFETPQVYYSDQLSEFQDNIENTPLTTSERIKPLDLNKTQILFDQLDSISIDTLRVSPRIRVKLDSLFFQQNILENQNSDVFASQNSFKNFLRGLFIKTEQIENGGALVNFNLNNEEANITLYYKSQRFSPTVDPENQNELIETFNKFNLNLRGNTINFYENSNTINLTTQDTINGEQNLFIKGGQGIIGVVKPFSGPDNDGNGVADEIDELREKNWLINEANLIFYIDETLAQELDFKPRRILVFDLDRKRVLIDYNIDQSSTNNPFTSKLNHLGPLVTDTDENSSFYKIRITNHIDNIINKDSTSTRIGVVVTQNVNQPNTLKVKDSELNQAEVFLESAMATPRGIIFHGNLSPDEDKRLKLQIFYTEPN